MMRLILKYLNVKGMMPMNKWTFLKELLMTVFRDGMWDLFIEIVISIRGWILMNKKLYIFFSLTSFAYMLSVSVYLLNSFIMLNDTIFAVTRILMICCLLIFLLFGLKLKTIAKIEGNNQTLTKFQHIQKVWSIVIITSLIILVFRDFVWIL